MPPVPHMLSQYVPALRPYSALAGQRDPVSNVKTGSSLCWLKTVFSVISMHGL